MSYWISIGDFNRNLSWNGNKIYFKHIDHDMGIRLFDGLTGKKAGPIIEEFIASVQEEQDCVGCIKQSMEYTDMEGKGSFIGKHLTFMFSFYLACVENPDKVISVN